MVATAVAGGAAAAAVFVVAVLGGRGLGATVFGLSFTVGAGEGSAAVVAFCVAAPAAVGEVVSTCAGGDKRRLSCNRRST